MSRIGKQAISVPGNITVEVNGNIVTVKGSKGELKQDFPTKLLTVTVGENEVVVARKTETIEARAKHGLFRSLIANMVEGLDKGFSKELEINGVGYRANLQGAKLVLSLGYSHPIEFTPPEGVLITINDDKKNILVISGIDKQKVGQAAAEIRSFRKPEPYKGKGIKYIDEHIVRKAGKAAAKAE